jgi:hypothetical protein
MHIQRNTSCSLLATTSRRKWLLSLFCNEMAVRKDPVESGKGEAEKEPEGEARKAVQKWDGKWGLRETAASGKDIGWSWGRRELV